MQWTEGLKINSYCVVGQKLQASREKSWNHILANLQPVTKNMWTCSTSYWMVSRVA
jgi:hypothetical protein